MKKLKIILLIIAIGAFMVLAQQSCQSGNSTETNTPEVVHHEEDYHSLLEQIHAQSVDSINYDMENPYLEAQLPVVEVEANLNGKNKFYVESVKGKLNYFPCSNCHTEPLDKLQKGLNQSQKDSHWEISLKHASSKVMNCQTCHDPKQPDSLYSLSGASVSFDHSYQLCSQCHSTQFKDWVGGAHGKRLGGWVEPRVAKTCVSCHNPHKPAIGSRWPARLNTFKLKMTESH